MSRPWRGPGAVRARGDHRRRVGQVAGRVERADDDGAGAVDLDGAVGGAVGLDDVGRGEVLLEVERLTPVGALVARGVRPLGDGDGAEILGSP